MSEENGTPPSEESKGEESGDKGLSAETQSAIAALEGMGGSTSALSEIQKELGSDEGGGGEDPPKKPDEEKPSNEEGNPPEENLDEEEELKKEGADDAPKEDKDDKGGEPKEEPEDKEDPEKKSEEDEITIDSPIFGEKGKKIKGKGDDKKTTPEFENLDEINAYLKKNIGVDSIDKLEDKVSEWKGIEEKHKEDYEKLTKAEQIFKAIPPELYQAVDNFLKGEDWREPIVSRPVFDFNKDAKDVPSQDLVNAYFKDEFSKEDWDEYNDPDGDPGIKKAINTAINVSREKFDRDKNAVAERTEKMTQQQQDQMRRYEESISESVSSLNNDFEGIDKGYISEVEKDLKGNGIMKLFYNEDGTLKPDAAKKFVMAKDGYELMESYKKQITNRAKSEAREEILDRVPDKPKKGGGKSTTRPDEVRPEVKQKVEELTDGLLPKNTY